MGRACSLVAARPYVCVQQRNGAREEEGDGEGGDRQEAAHIILRASSGWSPLRIMAHSARQQWERRAFVHISIRSAFSSIKQTQLCPCCLSGHLPGRHLDSWSPSPKEPLPLRLETRHISQSVLIIITEERRCFLPSSSPLDFIALKQGLQTAERLSVIG